MALTGVSLTSNDPATLAAFFQQALGFAPDPDAAPPPLGATAAIWLRYGGSRLQILGFAEKGRGMPPGQAANDHGFQHFALLVPDIDVACDKLARFAFTPISPDGPVKLPASSGGVTAFKFRDPEGHPLEFLQPLKPTPARLDHTAIVVADTQTSVKFYAAYGLSVQGGSLNAGPEQAALDGLTDPVVKVTRLGSTGSALALELLCYHQPAGAPPPAHKASSDVAATRLLCSAGPATGLQHDPDGHDLLVAG